MPMAAADTANPIAARRSVFIFVCSFRNGEEVDATVRRAAAIDVPGGTRGVRVDLEANTSSVSLPPTKTFPRCVTNSAALNDHHGAHAAALGDIHHFALRDASRDAKTVLAGRESQDGKEALVVAIAAIALRCRLADGRQSREILCHPPIVGIRARVIDGLCPRTACNSWTNLDRVAAITA